VSRLLSFIFIFAECIYQRPRLLQLRHSPLLTDLTILHDEVAATSLLSMLTSSHPGIPQSLALETLTIDMSSPPSPSSLALPAQSKKERCGYARIQEPLEEFLVAMAAPYAPHAPSYCPRMLGFLRLGLGGAGLEKERKEWLEMRVGRLCVLDGRGCERDSRQFVRSRRTGC